MLRAHKAAKEYGLTGLLEVYDFTGVSPLRLANLYEFDKTEFERLCVEAARESGAKHSKTDSNW